MFHRFGVDVTVMEQGSSLLNKEDREVADILVELLRKKETCSSLSPRVSTPV